MQHWQCQHHNCHGLLGPQSPSGRLVALDQRAEEPQGDADDANKHHRGNRGEQPLWQPGADGHAGKTQKEKGPTSSKQLLQGKSPDDLLARDDPLKKSPDCKNGARDHDKAHRPIRQAVLLLIFPIGQHLRMQRAGAGGAHLKVNRSLVRQRRNLEHEID